MNMVNDGKRCYSAVTPAEVGRDVQRRYGMMNQIRGRCHLFMVGSVWVGDLNEEQVYKTETSISHNSDLQEKKWVAVCVSLNTTPHHKTESLQHFENRVWSHYRKGNIMRLESPCYNGMTRSCKWQYAETAPLGKHRKESRLLQF